MEKKDSKKTSNNKEEAKKENKEQKNEKDAEGTEKKVPVSPKELISFRELIILIIGVIIIFAIIIAIPHVFKKEQKGLEIMHVENFGKKESENNYIYNGFSFLKLPDERTSVLFWYTQVKVDGQLYDMPMRHGPKELEDIKIEVINPTEKRNYSSTLYITTEARNEPRGYLGVAIAELNEKLTMIKKYDIKSAYSTNSSLNNPVIAVMECETNKENIIIRLEDDKQEPKIQIDDNCLIIQGSNESIIKAADKLIYKLVGII